MSDALIRELRSESRPEREETLGSKAQKRRIFLEGSGDVKFFEATRIADKFNVLFVTHENPAKGGKQFVIDSVRKIPSTLGIVDMDHDLGSTDIKFSNNIIDTSRSCCLFSWIMFVQGKTLIEVVKDFVRELFKQDFRKQWEISRTVSANSEIFTNLVNELTMARLFRGYNGNLPTSVGGLTELGIELEKLSDLSLATQHKIPPAYRVDFSDYKEKYREKLDDVGYNDHDVVDALHFLIYSSGIDLGPDKVSNSFLNFQSDKLGTVEQREDAAKQLVLKLLGEEE
jgi:hypothetical protein